MPFLNRTLDLEAHAWTVHNMQITDSKHWQENN